MRISLLFTRQFEKYLLNNCYTQGSENVEVQEPQTHSSRPSQYLGGKYKQKFGILG